VYEDDLIERIVIPNLQHIDTDSNIIVRNAASQLLVELCVECENKRCLELMDILEKVWLSFIKKKLSMHFRRIISVAVMSSIHPSYHWSRTCIVKSKESKVKLSL
jgi:hypothetical protein